MRTSRILHCLVLEALFVGSVLASSTVARGASQAESAIPGLLDLKDVKMEIAAVTFVKEYQGSNGTFRETQLDKYRGMVVTLAITKPAGEALALHAADLNLHYRHGSDYDVSPCHGVSGFSTQMDQDRDMLFIQRGFGKQTTKLASTGASKIYVDLFFENMEPDSSDMYLLVAQPIGASYQSKGWK